MMIREVLSAKGDMPFLIIVCVVLMGVVVLFINILIVTCYVHRKRNKDVLGHTRHRDDNKGSEGKKLESRLFFTTNN